MNKGTVAFTLVEVLLVISIIAMLSAIVFPVFAQAREKARQSVCASNLRQIGMAVAMYRTDYDDYFPYAVDNAMRFNPENNGSPNRARWLEMPTLPEALQPYCKSQSIFHCPSDARSFNAYRSDGSSFLAQSRYVGYGMSYSFNQSLGFSGLRDGDQIQSSLLYYASDVSFDFHSYANASYYDLQGNILYCDGHVRFHRAPQ